MSVHGRFAHVELLTPSLEKTIPFLAELLGLEVLFIEGDAPFYGLARPGSDLPYFGVMAIVPSPEARSHWIAYLADDAHDAAGRTAGENGASILLQPPEPDELDGTESGPPPAMWFLADPQGAVFALVPGDGAQPGIIGPEVGPGGASWFELLTSDVDAAAEFYAAVFGWDVAPAEGNDGSERVLTGGGSPAGLIRPLQPGSPMPPHWLPCLRVADLDATLGRVRALGGFLFEDPTPIPGGRRAVVLEPTGAPIGLWQPDAT
jgi:predicted enzyme related to lactoylglutathione lyase